MNKNYLALIREFISFKSISTDPKYKGEITETVNWLKNKFKEKGFKVEIVKGFGNPLVLANFIFDKKLPTLLIYGHYDVQPADKNDRWKDDPFKVFEDKENLYARGIVDNKGQILIHIATVFELIENKKLNYNIKFLIEGDEETGSDEIERFIKENCRKLTADSVLISDGELTGKHACLDSSFRGIVNFILKVKTSSKDNHSGLFGGSIPNAGTELVNILNKMHDKNGNVTIPGIINTKKFDKSVLKNNKGIPFSDKEFLNITGAKKRLGENKLDFYTQTGFLTSVEITTLSSGYMGEGYRNAVPGEATAKINFRLAPNLNVKDAIKIFESFIKKNTPDFLEYEITPDQYSEGFFVKTDSNIAKKAKAILRKSYKTEVYDRPCGAVIPTIGFFIKYLKVPVVSVGLANEDCNMHGSNENFKKDFLKKGLEFSKLFLSS